jgi:phospholipid/cholesterol/gamma-HCH transport system substrate-binding protein
MQRNANYALVGIASMVLIIGLIAFSLWLAAFRLGQTYDAYDIVLKGPVRGLSEGGQVRFNGIKVGEVTGISLDPSDPALVIARTRVTSDVPIRVDSYAMLEPQGITGVNYVQITAGTPTLQLLKDTVPENSVPRIRSQPGALTEMLDDGSNVLARATEALERIDRVLSDENIERLSTILEDIQAVTAELRERKSIIAEAEDALASANQAAQEIGQFAKSGNTLVTGDGRHTLVKLGDAATEIEFAANNFRTVLDTLEDPLGDFATTGLPQITSAIASLQQAANNLDRTLDEVQQNPQGLVAKPPAREIEVKP